MWIPLVIICITTGIVLTSLGYSLRTNDSYLKESDHKWYQIVYIDDNNHLRIGGQFQDVSIVGIDIPLP